MEYVSEAVKLAEQDGEARVLCRMAQAGIFSTRHHYLHHLDDLDQAIKIREELVATVDASHPMMPIIKQHLTASLSNRFDHIVAQLPSWTNASEKDRELYKQAASDVVSKQIELLEKLINTDPSNSHLDHFQVSLATALLARGGLMGKRKEDVVDKKDLDEAISLLSSRSKSDSTNAATACGVDQGYTVQMLGQALYGRYLLFGRNVEDLQSSVSVLSNASNSSTLPPNQRLYAATYWFQFLLEENSRTGQHVSACLDALTTMMGLLPSIVWIGMSIQDRHNALTIPTALEFGRLETPLLKSIAHIPSRAASFAISNGELARAIEWLEQGRSILWHQLLQFRSPMDELKQEDENLAERLANLASGLAISSTRAHFRDAEADTTGKVSVDVEALKHRKLAEDWELALEHGRKLPGLEKFLLPKDFAYLSRAGSHGIVVIINVDLCDCQCDALIMYPGQVSNGEAPLRVPLRGGITFQDAERMRIDFLSLVQDDFGFRAESTRKPVFESDLVLNEEERTAMFKEILSELWYKIVGPILRALIDHRPGLIDANPSKRRERIHWCLTGPLAFLPLHAAGDYTKSEYGHKVYDYVISSYIPTLESIIRGNDISHTAAGSKQDDTKTKVLAVACPKAGGHQYIPATKDEVQIVEKQATAASLDFAVLKDRDATASRVLNELKTANWAHFACHGVQNTESPTQSALLLADGSRLLLTDIAAVDLPRAELAFLSACQTATGYDKLPSESIHLAAGMLLAGYRSVVATMWSISDRDAPGVAEDFYGYMLREEKRERPDYRESAAALHVAVEKLRKRVGEDKFLSWVPYIHIGV
ncbi:hypothetical protein BDZ89DRAFT_797783 [Hymenopellis radicata]|nr:hypothetical protein BDZ89DRAFT_797783 [Hymenopellis radicata]